MYPAEKSSIPAHISKDDGAPESGKGPLPSYSTATSGPSTAFQTRFASVSMHMEDRIRFLQFPTPIIDICRQTIAAVWTRGIQAEREYAGSQEIKLYGRPWRGAGDEAVMARRLICALLGTLHGQGWVLTLSTDISKKNWDKDTLLFRHQVPTPAACDWCCIGFSKNDRIKFIDGMFVTSLFIKRVLIPLLVPSEVSNGLVSRIGLGRVQDHFIHSRDVYEVKLVGTPW